jgi:hypothetical protein
MSALVDIGSPTDVIKLHAEWNAMLTCQDLVQWFKRQESKPM